MTLPEILFHGRLEIERRVAPTHADEYECWLCLLNSFL